MIEAKKFYTNLIDIGEITRAIDEVVRKNKSDATVGVNIETPSMKTSIYIEDKLYEIPHTIASIKIIPNKNEVRIYYEGNKAVFSMKEISKIKKLIKDILTNNS